MERQKLSDGIYFNTINQDKFKTNKISVHFVLPLDKTTATANAVVPFILRKSYKDCPDFTLLNQKLSDLYGAYLDVDIKKLGDNQIINISISTIDDSFSLNNEKLTEQCCEILCNVIFTPDFINGEFKKTDFELEKQYLIDTIESEINDKRIFALKRLEEIMCKNEPSGVSKLGQIEDAKNLNSSTATQAYYNMIENARIEIIFVGVGDSEPCKSIFNNHINKISRNKPHNPTIIINNDVSEIKEVSEQFKVNQAKMVLGFRTGIVPNDDEVYAMRLLVSLYGGTPFSRLFVNVREKLSLCYYCAARFDKSKGIITVDCGVEQQNIQKAKQEILNQLEIIKNGEFEVSEFENAKLSLIDSLKSVTDSPTSIEIWNLTQILFGTTNSPTDEAEKIQEVTFERIVEVSKKIKLDTVYILECEN